MAKFTNGEYGIKTYSTDTEHLIREEHGRLISECPIPPDQIINNIQLFINSKQMARILFMNHIYSQIVDVMGVVMEFGTRWGPNMAEFAALRGVYEPFNRHRKIVGFDTFEGFPHISSEDGTSNMMQAGHLALPKDYNDYLEKILSAIESDNPISHIRKFEIVKGDAIQTVPAYLDRHPETIVALAYFDFDVYAPTKAVLELIKDRLVKGSVVAFDEACDEDSPGETQAIMEVFGLPNVRLQRLPYCSRTSYFVVE